MAAYIDLNPVRAGLCEDPKDYRWSGHAEAVAGGRLARAGAVRVHTGQGRAPTWEQALAAHRVRLFTDGERRADDPNPNGPRARRAIDPEKARAVVESGGKLPMAEALRHRVRHFTDGAALGGKAFLEAVFQARREQFSAKRKDGPRPLRGADWDGLNSLRDLRKAP